MENQIDNDLKLALKSGDKFTLSVLRMLKSEIINESRKGSLHTLTDDEVLKDVSFYTSTSNSETGVALEQYIDRLTLQPIPYYYRYIYHKDTKTSSHLQY